MAAVDPVVGGYRMESGNGTAHAAIPSRTVGGGAIPVGAVIALLGLWAAMVPYAGPAFGYSADGSAAWHWNLAHALLGLVPGAIALVAGLLVIAAGAPARLGARRTRSALLAAAAAVCGAWLAIGAFAWPVLYRRGYLRPATPLQVLEHVAGSGLGSGILLALFGGMGVVLAAHGGAVVPLGLAARSSLRRSATVPMRLVASGRDEEPAPPPPPLAPSPAPPPARVSTAQRPESGGPESGGPESGGPESGGPESGGPESGGPESGGPESGGPESGGMPTAPKAMTPPPATAEDGPAP